ncbi:hypothetical protein C2I36_13135 [Rhodobacteraceae bacterium WD3A24]|nr:hypothetical protein C2I36_13135 [Rhodobacteraceae bacterium WD3A24]
MGLVMRPLRYLKSFLRSDIGATTVDYVILAAMTTGIAIGSVVVIGSGGTDLAEDVGSGVSAIDGALPSAGGRGGASAGSASAGPQDGRDPAPGADRTGDNDRPGDAPGSRSAGRADLLNGEFLDDDDDLVVRGAANGDEEEDEEEDEIAEEPVAEPSGE